MTRLATILLLALAVCAQSNFARAAVPSPQNSSFPSCLVLCPFGDIQFSCVIRDLASNPVAAASVVLDFSPCPGAHICTTQPPDHLLNLPARTIRIFTDANGQGTFQAHVGGTCFTSTVNVIANGVLMRQFALASPDQDADGVVTATGNDLVVFNGKLGGGTDVTADFDCSSSVDANDLTILTQHHMHGCSGVVDVRRRSWGGIKQHYR